MIAHAAVIPRAAQIVTGIGFLGGGAIILAGREVQGLTTAATIWMNAGVGMAAGSGQYRLASLATATSLLVLTALVPLERFLARRHDSPAPPPLLDPAGHTTGPGEQPRRPN